MASVKTAILPVAGFGTRVLPATKSIPKEMLPIIDRPAIQYVVDEALQAGIEHIVFVTGRNKGAIEDYFDINYELEEALEKKGKLDIKARLETMRIPAGMSTFTRQQSALGLGHAVWCGRDVVGREPFAVLLPDVIIKSEKSCTAQMIEAYDKVGGNIIAVDQVPEEQVHKYGVISPVKRDGRLIEMNGMVEKPAKEEAPSNLKITGRYILQPEIFDLLEDQGPGAGNEIQLTDAMERLMKQQQFFAFEYEGQDYDCGSIAGYFETVFAHAADHPETAAMVKALAKKYA
ncbi:UTP--glucose-1-phosphate uridylyltransferase GalU [Ponticaulis profundi]|uniref:UTP--glucose-1-phosphate uridylyltransferase n=1 Tax=Ponticaulis profundi TaxID=2665222 RepID=A0ABW1S819_9PROT